MRWKLFGDWLEFTNDDGISFWFKGREPFVDWWEEEYGSAYGEGELKTSRTTSKPRGRSADSTPRENASIKLGKRKRVGRLVTKKSAGDGQPRHVASCPDDDRGGSPSKSGQTLQHDSQPFMDLANKIMGASKKDRPKRIRILFPEQPPIEIKPDPKPAAKVERKLTGLRHLQRLADAMKPDAREYEYRGEITDAGEFGREKCACGHPIRYVFIVRHKIKNTPVNIGSVCIETSVPWLLSNGNEALATALTGAVAQLQEQIKLANKQAREANASKDVAAVMKEWQTIIDWHKDAHDVWRRSVHPFAPDFLRKKLSIPTAKSTPGHSLAAAIKAYCRRWILIRDFIWATDSRFKFPPPPAPAHEGLRKALRVTLLRTYAQFQLQAKYRLYKYHSDTENDRFNAKVESYRVLADEIT